LTKATDLLQAKWRGKIATEDPTSPAAQQHAARIYLQMGEDFVKNLLGQKE
jgi:ABC-type Fe3+ transport system substrate-binding protein